jgi:hypothetical protein
MINFTSGTYHFSLTLSTPSFVVLLITLATLYYVIKPTHGYQLTKGEAIKYSILTSIFPALTLGIFILLLIPFFFTLQNISPAISLTIMLSFVATLLLSPLIFMVFKMRYAMSTSLLIICLSATSAGITEYIIQRF